MWPFYGHHCCAWVTSVATSTQALALPLACRQHEHCSQQEYALANQTCMLAESAHVRVRLCVSRCGLMEGRQS